MKGKGAIKEKGPGERGADEGTTPEQRDLAFLKTDTNYKLSVEVGLVPGMRVPGRIYVGEAFRDLLEKEIVAYHDSSRHGFMPAVMQIANVATLPGIVGASIGLPDIHSGYGFAVGHVAAFDLDNPDSVVSPGGVGYDINCGVRLIRTNLRQEEVEPHKEALLDTMFKLIPAGVGQNSGFRVSEDDFTRVLVEGMGWAQEQGLAWPEDRENVEDRGCIAGARAETLSDRCRKRGAPQLGSLGSGNHYAELQVVEEIYDLEAARAMGIAAPGQVCIMLHCGSRGLGHQVCEEAVKVFDEKLAEAGISLIDRQLSCFRANSDEARDYLAGMAAAANFAFVNRSVIAGRIRQAFETVFGRGARDMDMHIVYDVAHNIAKIEEHEVDGQLKRLLVHRKGSSRAFGPGHPLVPERYQAIGQPVLIGGSMGTCSYVLTGTARAMRETFGSTCHGAGRALSRNQTKKVLNPQEVIANLNAKGISIRVGQMNAVVEEAPEAYKDVTEVVGVCERAGISKRAFRLRPIGVIKG